jgi:hypothetical protein
MDYSDILIPTFDSNIFEILTKAGLEGLCHKLTKMSTIESVLKPFGIIPIFILSPEEELVIMCKKQITKEMINAVPVILEIAEKIDLPKNMLEVREMIQKVDLDETREYTEITVYSESSIMIGSSLAMVIFPTMGKNYYPTNKQPVVITDLHTGICNVVSLSIDSKEKKVEDAVKAIRALADSDVVSDANEYDVLVKGLSEENRKVQELYVAYAKTNALLQWREKGDFTRYI